MFFVFFEGGPRVRMRRPPVLPPGSRAPRRTPRPARLGQRQAAGGARGKVRGARRLQRGVYTLLRATERGVCCREGGRARPRRPPRSRRGLFLSSEPVWTRDPRPARAPAPRGRPGLFFPRRPLPRRCPGFSRCFYDYIVCVGGSAVGVARERAVPGRSFINVTHIMILSAASY